MIKPTETFWLSNLCIITVHEHKTRDCAQPCEDLSTQILLLFPPFNFVTLRNMSPLLTINNDLFIRERFLLRTGHTHIPGIELELTCN